MPDFEQQRIAWSRSQAELASARQAQLLARESVRVLERELESLARTDAGRGSAKREELTRRLHEARAESERRTVSLERAQKEASLAHGNFEAFSDPRSQIAHWSDAAPILLLPLRLETRFKQGLRGQPQLWVRIYPDSCFIDTFEASLTETEIQNARAFWGAVWRAAGDEALEREAWRQLVASHGSGRAGWIVRQYQPLNPGEKPSKLAPSDVLLIIAAAAPLPVAALRYWEALWRAVGDGAAQNAAYQQLEADLGAVLAREIAEHTRPHNFGDEPAAPLKRNEVRVQASVVQLAAPESLPLRRTSWSSAARVTALPERFAVIGYRGGQAELNELGGLIQQPLIVSPDPNAAPEQQLKPGAGVDDDTLQIPEDIAWMFDFDKAVAAGMALRIDLTPQQAAVGFDRIIVLGVRLADSAQQGSARLQELLEHHLHSRAGLEILPQGTPTNNTEQGGAGYSTREDAQRSFPIFMRDTPAYSLQSEPLRRADGQWLAEALGLSHELVQRIPNAGGSDQLESRAMNLALWPGTIGYMMKTLLAPVFSEADVDATRGFFTRHVSGRGPLPALRIGRQPYGIVLTTDFERLNWYVGERKSSYLSRLYRVLARMDEQWKALVDEVSHVGKAGDPHQTLLDVLGLHAASAEYYPLQADSIEHKYHELSFLDFALASDLLSAWPTVLPLALLRSHGYTGAEIPDLLNKMYRAGQTPLDGPVIDGVPLSENEPIRASAGARNYLEWLIDAARSGIEALQREQGFDPGKKPNALLYLLLRNALQLSFHDTGLKLGLAVGEVAELASLRREPAFIHIREEQARSESRYERLFKPDMRITGSASLRLGDYIARNLNSVDPQLSEQVAALEQLRRVPTARLERVFAEHIDCCSYRLDAWRTGLYAHELEQMRQRADKNNGLYLGAYGWLEPLSPKGGALKPIQLPEDLAEPINRRDKAPLMQDAGNLGLIHAPSINHATTAAVLRNGYLANEGQLAINLSSRRVRLALGILEGMRNGQSPGALLGYHFERHLHDRGPLQVRALIYPLRRAFPLAANQIAATNNETGTAQESIAAMNVVDGRKLIEHVAKVNNFIYPFGLNTLPRPSPDNGQEAAINAALAHIRDINDAVADLVLAEGVHQAVVGNYERSAGTLDAFAKGNYPPEPEVIRTPRSGVVLTLRSALHLPHVPLPTPLQPLPPNPTPTIALTPLALAEPAINVWLAGRLPPPTRVGCNVRFTDRATDLETTVFIDQEQLGLQPIDVLYRCYADAQQGVGDLDERIVQYVHTNHAPRHDRDLAILHTQRTANRITWFELQALLRSLRALLLASRPLQPADVQRSNDATSEAQAQVVLSQQRIEAGRDALVGPLLANLTALDAALADLTLSIDTLLDQFAATAANFAVYRLPQTGVAFVYDWRSGVYASVTKKLKDRVELWDRRLRDYDARIAAYDASLPGAPPESERMAALQSAELTIITALTASAFANSAAYRTGLNAQRAAFVAKRNALMQVTDAARATVDALLSDAEAQLPLTAFDHTALDFFAERDEEQRMRRQLTERATQLRADVNKRITQVNNRLASVLAAADSAQRVRLLQEAGRQLYGDDFLLVPQITLPPAAAAELTNAWQHSRSGKLTEFLTTTQARDFPVDDWLHGVARVRDKLRHWENVASLSSALGGTQATELVPLQLPFAAEEPWLALELPPGHAIRSDRLLYTAHFAEDFDAARPVCGLMLDEWTEVIPGVQETTGVAFHYDRPNSEPPQTFLLALPAIRNGSWSWDELLGAVVHALNAAKRRAVEPAHLDRTAYSWFLPATMSAYTFPEISISNNLLRNVDIYSRFIEESP